MSSNGDGMLTRWERKILLDKVHGIDIKPENLRAVEHRVKKRLLEAVKDLHLILSVFPDLRNVTGVTNGLMRGVGFEPTNPYGTGAPIRPLFHRILSPAPLTRLGYPRAAFLLYILAVGVLLIKFRWGFPGLEDSV